MSDMTSLLTGENAALVACIIAIISTARAVMKGLFQRKVVQRFLPLVPVALGVTATLLGFGSVEGLEGGWQSAIVLGIVVGFTAGSLFKAGKTSILGLGTEDQPKELS